MYYVLKECNALYVTNLCENKIAVDPWVVEKIQKLKTERSLQPVWISLATQTYNWKCLKKP